MFCLIFCIIIAYSFCNFALRNKFYPELTIAFCLFLLRLLLFLGNTSSWSLSLVSWDISSSQVCTSLLHISCFDWSIYSQWCKCPSAAVEHLLYIQSGTSMIAAMQEVATRWEAVEMLLRLAQMRLLVKWRMCFQTHGLC